MSEPRTLKGLLPQLIQAKGSDLHIPAMSPPRLRLDGLLIPMPGEEVVSVEESKKLCVEFANEDLQKTFQSQHEIDFSFGIEGLSRFRANVYLERESVAGAFRALPWKIPSPDTLHLPAKVQDLAQRPNGLILTHMLPQRWICIILLRHFSLLRQCSDL